ADLEAVRQPGRVRAASQQVEKAIDLPDQNRPAEALELLEKALKSNVRDAGVLGLAGMAAYQSDRIQDAIRYWEASLELEPNEPVQRLLTAARREAAEDARSQKLLGAR